MRCTKREKHKKVFTIHEKVAKEILDMCAEQIALLENIEELELNLQNAAKKLHGKISTLNNEIEILKDKCCKIACQR